MAGTVKASVLQHDVTGVAPVIRDGAGTEIGRLCRSWTNYTGGTQVVNGSFNISSITRTGTGSYTNNFATAMATNTYSATTSNISWACFIGTPLTTSYVIGSFVTTTGSGADYQVFGMVVS